VESASPTSVRALSRGDRFCLTLAGDRRVTRDENTQYVMRAERTASADPVRRPRRHRPAGGVVSVVPGRSSFPRLMPIHARRRRRTDSWPTMPGERRARSGSV
jgi:hypothetical protein